MRQPVLVENESVERLAARLIADMGVDLVPASCLVGNAVCTSHVEQVSTSAAARDTHETWTRHRHGRVKDGMIT